MKSLLSVAICALTFCAIRHGECTSWRHCPPNEVYRDCVDLCNTCEYRGHCSMQESCQPGCDCRTGYFRNKTGICVKEKECDDSEPSPCREDEEFLECGCVKSCCNRGNPEACAAQCLKGCFCRNGLVRDKIGRCIPLEDCPNGEPLKKCPKEDEEYYEQMPDCYNTCEHFGTYIYCEPGKPGCFCKEGLVKRKDGQCVPFEECKNDEKCSKKDEQYYEHMPDCYNTCEHYGSKIYCPLGEPGCFCKKGLVKRKDGKCVPLKECKKDKKCTKKDEQYYEEIPDCYNTCEHYGTAIACLGPTRSGCFCKKGLVKRKDGQCVPFEECHNDKRCKKDEQYYDNKPDCKNTCENYDNAAVLCLIGEPGCFCKKGLVKRKDGKCVTPDKCRTTDECGLNEEYSLCASRCNDCVTRGNCESFACNEGCDCIAGYHRNSKGVCIPENECPEEPKTCTREGEVFKPCGSPCEAKCSTLKIHILIKCPLPCEPGCFCRDGLVRDWENNCVTPEECEEEECKENEEYLECGPACPRTCDNVSPHCIEKCTKGCFCKKGFIWNYAGICVPEEQCPGGSKKCTKKGEVYKSCGSRCAEPGCPLPFKIGVACPEECTPGCYCRDGLVRDGPNGKCIKPSQCKNVTICGENEEYSKCGSSCPATCDRPHSLCKLPCREGCFCKEGFVRSKDYKCILEDQCPDCGENEEIVDCAKPKWCNTCDIKGNCKLTHCSEGCDCKRDYYRNDEGVCIPESQCPGSNKCTKKGEVYKECGSRCGEPRCPTKFRIGIVCPNECTPGCYCKDGLVRDGNGNCIKPNQCKNETCGKNEEYSHCGSACPGTCDRPYPVCKLACEEGCFCKEGFVRSKDNECIPQDQCPKRCVKNEEYSNCGSACPATCDDRDPICNKRCQKGCFCKEGFVRSKDYTCIPEDQCPYYCDIPICGPDCKINYETKPCPTCDCEVQCDIPKCGLGCKINYETKPCPSCDCEVQCTLPLCRPGCKINYETKPCPSCDCEICNIPECDVGCKINYKSKPCPTCDCKEPPCHKDEEYVECVPCGNTCETYEQRLYCKPACKPGCTCKDGLVKRKDGKCVSPDECDSHHHPCGSNEEYNSCGTACQATCDDRNPKCTKQCVKGCFCRRGYIREKKGGKCIPQRHCPNIEHRCHKDEEYVECVPCGNTCETYGARWICKYSQVVRPCIPGCTCKGDLVKRKDGKCVSPEECDSHHQHCGPFEKYSSCVNPCNDCFTRGDCDFIICNEGCDCIRGYHRTHLPNGRCIPASQCPKNNTCGKNEEYKFCGSACPPTCESPDPVCTEQCVKGCFCKEGYLKDDTGVCIPKYKCPKNECGRNEEYKTCGSACPPTCDNLYTSCTEECVAGCFCKKGYIQDKSGKCIPISHCPKNQCGRNEEYKTCGTACPPTCSNLNPVCTKQCVPGCFCKKGYIRQDEECIPERQCPEDHHCGRNEEYKTCGTACPPTCSNRNPTCTKQCVKGCFCKKGYIRQDGKCIPERQCPDDHHCGRNEEYKTCGTACPPTCSNRNPVCTKPCVKGCFCKKGYIRQDGKCIPERQCPEDHHCGRNEEYKTCGTACPPTCSNRNPVCTEQCVPGCFCKKGYIRQDGKCIPERQCPEDHHCGRNEEYKTCGPACPPTCNNRNPTCTKLCVKGCFCKKGYIRQEGKCIPERQCPEDHHCGRNEEYKTCGTACPPTCSNRNPKCTKQCVPGCFCKKGYIRQDGKCIPKRQCPEDHHCGRNEEYKTCGTACPPTCSNRNPICTKQCVPGCFCKKGYIRQDGECIPERQCPDDHQCGRNEKYKTCGTACPPTCSNRNPVCTKPCVKGCFCKKGYIRQEGKCIPERQCPKETCGANEIYMSCGTACQPTCSTPNPSCNKKCVKGCFCKKGFIRIEKGGICIDKGLCENECGPNEVYSTCVIPCNTCEIKGKCNFLVCNKGCDCKKGYYRNEKGKCIPESQCPNKPPEECGENEQYYDCIPDCRNKCETYNKENVFCTAICKRGCFCKKGLVKRKDGKCVKPSECENPPEKCTKKDETYYNCTPSCKNTCRNYNNPGVRCACGPPGCFCKEGLVQTDDGKCVKPDQCPQNIKKCKKKDETYYECTPSCKNTCKNYNNPGIRCGCGPPGCYCKEGLVKNEDNGKCVKPEKCPQNPNTCGIHEIYNKCGTACEPNCKDLKPKCKRKCVKGCFCKKGYVRLSKGKGQPCVDKGLCETDEPPEKCGRNEEYYPVCAPNCHNTCETYNRTDIVCPYSCGPGCFCKKGLVKRKDGECVKPSDCSPDNPPEKCGKNEKYYKGCKPVCKNTCDTYNKTGPCPFICIHGCGCKSGYVYNKKKECVKISECDNTDNPPEKCGKNEKYYHDCKPACKNTCDTYNKDYFCSIICEPGCGCKPGYVYNKNGECVKTSECDNPDNPPEKCGKNEKYYKGCKPVCMNTCDTYNKPVPCPYICTPGCGCKSGYVYNKDRVCVKKSDCPTDKPPEKCGRNEEYYDCMFNCHNTCETYNKTDVVCPQSCVPGCFCKKGLVKRKDGECVKPSECSPDNPPEKCGKNEKYYEDCKPVCKDTCETYNKEVACPDFCIPGCGCKPGYVYNKKRVCVKPSECDNSGPPKNCGKDEQYYDCIPSCKGYCSTYNKNIACKMPCVAGCFCKPGLLKTEDGKCVPPKKCPNSDCGPDEEYYECMPDCLNRCKPLEFCSALCRGGCFCRKGLVLREDGKCVKKEQCTSPKNCKKDEKYYECMPNCRNTCEAYGKDDVVCTAVCTSGCFCKEKLVKRKDGKCVKPDQCKKDDHPCPKLRCRKNCYLDEYHKPCPRCVCPAEPPYYPCPVYECARGCYLDILNEPCPKCVCKDSNGGLPCPTKTICPPGCDLNKKNLPCAKCECYETEDRPCPQIKCAPGFHLDETAKPCPKCVCDTENPDECPEVHCGGICRLDKDHKPCPECVCDGCPEVRCGGDCHLDSNHKPCPQCVCDKPPPKCPHNEKFSKCVVPCNDCITKGMCNFLVCNKGCDCIEGYYRNETGHCIPESKCPNCPEVTCGGICRLDKDHKPCPQCVCDGCPEVRCGGDCYLDENHKPCPECVCDEPRTKSDTSNQKGSETYDEGDSSEEGYNSQSGSSYDFESGGSFSSGKEWKRRSRRNGYEQDDDLSESWRYSSEGESSYSEDGTYEDQGGFNSVIRRKSSIVDEGGDRYYNSNSDEDSDSSTDDDDWDSDGREWRVDYGKRE